MVAGKGAGYVAPVMEAMNVGKVALDSATSKIDVATQGAVANAAGSGIQENAPPNAMQLAFQRTQERKAKKVAAAAPAVAPAAPTATAAPVATAVPPVTPAPTVPTETVETDTVPPVTPGTAWTPPGGEPPKAIVLQNRSRSDAAYVQQVAQIAGNSDPQRLSFSRDFASGAPVVMVEQGTQIAPEHLGREETVTAASGRKIPMRYAAAEADALLPSNQADGTANAEYATGAPGRIRVVAGNGRAVGIQGAYAKCTAEAYRSGIDADAALHGAAPAAWAAMRNPVLVRVMPEGEVTPDIGDESNQTGVAEQSALEKAKDDERRLDLTALTFNEDGDVATGAVITAKRRGISLTEFVKHKDFRIGPETAVVLAMLAKNERSAKKIGEALRMWLVRKSEVASNSTEPVVRLLDLAKHGVHGIQECRPRVLCKYANQSHRTSCSDSG